ncbi:prolyl 4-hydroxylase subunit alpha-1-like isoform X2 [Xenia sp. Carnegie-2017]|uniref:prolyl 4-hydroxylase subunit alpha-1-like isoform X2 n=1 Tax=Xenia sp. Carnegie-2017 TaxID=2897299 RepID=UPI001F03BC92|nr:prolyl 4-hydroxylase subunit alpha-1-like isoform X2 [Xenia sp. Carnegie-2017]
MNVIFCYLLIFQFCISKTDGAVYTAMTRVEDLALIEKTLVDSLEKFITREKLISNEVMTIVERIKLSLGDRNISSTADIFSNPLQVYALFRRFVYQWNSLKDLLNNDNSKDVYNQLDDFQPFFPTVEDLRGSISAIYLIQDTYNITADDLASGNIPGTSAPVEIHVDDCFEVGSFALYFGRYQHALGWLNVALKRVRRTTYKGNIDMKLLLEYASWAEYTRGNLKKALQHITELIEIENARRYGDELKTGLVKTYQHLKGEEDRMLTKKYVNTTLSRLCREERLRKSYGSDNLLLCRYKMDHPLLRLKPAKEEIVLVKPRIVIYRDILRDSEIETIKDVARPHLERSKAFDLRTGELQTVPYRISESAWIPERAASALKIFNRRAEAVSGLSTSTAEDLQVANYGLGGQYEEHHDHGYPNSPLENHVNGNRIATMLLYLTSIPYGGGTAFTRLKIHVKPSKGDVVFWYNLKTSGVGNNSTFHAACPVLSGIKWVGNKWFHLHGQEFRRRCTLVDES